jgi:hypothetical protein
MNGLESAIGVPLLSDGAALDDGGNDGACLRIGFAQLPRVSARRPELQPLALDQGSKLPEGHEAHFVSRLLKPQPQCDVGLNVTACS